MLQVTDLSFAFRHRQLFQGLTFQVKPGELVHVTGANGAGKTTLLALLAGLLVPSRGSVRLFNSEDSRQDLEYLPAEANGLFLKLDAGRNLRFWGELRHRDLSTAVIDRVLARWDLNAPLLSAGFPVERFSTGMKRRLGLARVELSKTRLWLLDEPLHGLDWRANGIVRDVLSEHLNAQGMVVITSHETETLKGLIKRVLPLHTV